MLNEPGSSPAFGNIYYGATTEERSDASVMFYSGAVRTGELYG
jgi:hypothetical protein